MANSLNFSPVNHNSTSQTDNVTQNEQKSGGGFSGALSGALKTVSNAPFMLKALGVLTILGTVAGATSTTTTPMNFTNSATTEGHNETTPLTTNSTTTYSTTGRPTTQTTLLPTSSTTNATSPATTPFTSTTSEILNHTSTQQQTTIGHTTNSTTGLFTATANPTNHTTNGTIPTTGPDYSGDIALWGIVGGFVLAGGAIATIAYRLLGDDGKEVTVNLTPVGETVKDYNDRLKVAAADIVKLFAKKGDTSEKGIHKLWDSLNPIAQQLSEVAVKVDENMGLSDEAIAKLKDTDFGGVFAEHIYDELVLKFGAVKIRHAEVSYEPVTPLQNYVSQTEEQSMAIDFMVGTQRAFTEVMESSINYVFNRRA